jgi:DNA end-binding protein Ku
MAARATASGTISFGLVSIPVKLYTAASSKAVRFNMLDPNDHSRVKQQYVNANSGEVVERGALVKGYEYARGQYVVMSEDELKELEAKSDRAIEIEAFVPMESVDPVYFEKSNLLGPDKGGQKAYKLLNQAMNKMNVVAVGRYATRGRQQLVLIRPMGEGLVLHGLYYADEVRHFDDIEFGDAVEVKKAELDLAEQLIEQLEEKSFRADAYEDDYRRAVLEAVDRKVAGEEFVVVQQEEEREQIIDLVAALKKSLDEKGDGATATSASGRPRKAAKSKGAASKKASKPARKRASK